MTDIDLDMLAYDIADLFDRNEYPIDATQDEIRAVLPAFLELLNENRPPLPGAEADGRPCAQESTEEVSG